MFLKALLSGHSKKKNEYSYNNQQLSTKTSTNKVSNTTPTDLTMANINSNPILKQSDASNITATSTNINFTVQKNNDMDKTENNTINPSCQLSVSKSSENKSMSSQQFKNVNSTIKNNFTITSNNIINIPATQNKTISTSSSLTNLSSSNLKNTNKIDIQPINTTSKQDFKVEKNTQNSLPLMLSKTSTISTNWNSVSSSSSNSAKAYDSTNSASGNKTMQNSSSNTTPSINSRLSFNKHNSIEKSANSINSRLSYPSTSTKSNSSVVDDEENSKRIFIGRLSEEVTKEMLFDCFKQYGPISEVYKKSDLSYGFVQYLEPTYADRAISYEDDNYRWGDYISKFITNPI